MKRACQILLLVAVAVVVFQIRTLIVSSYRLEKDYTQLWELADKSSTIPAKQKYISQFVDALESGYKRGDFSKHDAVWLDTPNNSFEANLGALKTLSSRLGEIQEMNPSSFEYNTAIQQITQQEQGEASRMLGVFGGCYTLSNYPVVWDWIGVAILLCSLLIITVTGLFLMQEYLLI